MTDTKDSEQQVRFERFGENLVSFRLNNLFISDNKFIFIAPQKDFCCACFQRRYFSQLDRENVEKPNDRTLNIARALDSRFKESNLWRWFIIEGQKEGKPFELISYEDCPACSKKESHTRAEAGVYYERLMSQDSTPKLDALKNQIFSFNFARGLVSDNQIGALNPAFKKIQGVLNQILGNNHHARIIARIVTSDGRQMDETTTGFALNKTMAELKSIMEYLERYAFSLHTCRLKTNKFDNLIIDDFLSLYSNTVIESERSYIQNNSCWGINLLTNEIHAIPSSFIFNEGRLRFILPTSNGFAAHIDYKKSLCNSILELVERDAFIRFWHDPQRAYNFEPDSDVKSAIESNIAALEIVLGNDTLVSKCYIVKSPTRLPVVMVTISSQDFSKPPALCFGFGTGFNTRDASLGALKELRINTSNLVKAISFFNGYLDRKFTTKIISSPDRMNFYSTNKPRAKLRFLDHDNPLVEGIVKNSDNCNLKAIVERFEQASLDIYGLDFTPRCFQDKNVFVTRAFSPQLFPLQFQQDNVFNLPTGPLSAHNELPHFFL